MRRLNQERGFTIVEMMVAVVVLLVGALGTLAMLDTANKRSRSAVDRQNGTALAREVVEAAQEHPVSRPRTGNDREHPAPGQQIAGVSASPWRIERDNTTFTVQIELCWLDEPADGLGSRAPGNFCSGSGAGGTDDGNSIDHKRVTVVTSWNNDAGTGTARQSTLVSARGGIDAPGVVSVQLASPATSPITDPAGHLRFVHCHDQRGRDSRRLVDRRRSAGDRGRRPRTWTFTWQLPPIDGAYDVSAQAFDPDGMGGEVRSATVVVNRFTPPRRRT